MITAGITGYIVVGLLFYGMALEIDKPDDELAQGSCIFMATLWPLTILCLVLAGALWCGTRVFSATLRFNPAYHLVRLGQYLTRKAMESLTAGTESKP